MKFSMLPACQKPLPRIIRLVTHFIHPPRPAPRKMTSFPFPSTSFVPETLRNEDIVGSKTVSTMERDPSLCPAYK